MSKTMNTFAALAAAAMLAACQSGGGAEPEAAASGTPVAGQALQSYVTGSLIRLEDGTNLIFQRDGVLRRSGTGPGVGSYSVSGQNVCLTVNGASQGCAQVVKDGGKTLWSQNGTDQRITSRRSV